VLGADMARERRKILHRINFESPYVGDAEAAHRPAESSRCSARSTTSATSRTAIAELAAELDLTEFLDRPSGQLSAGQKTRVALGQVADQLP
jgi:ABC-2 type transport system ATP-binding protein